MYDDSLFLIVDVLLNISDIERWMMIHHFSSSMFFGTSPISKDG